MHEQPYDATGDDSFKNLTGKKHAMDFPEAEGAMTNVAHEVDLHWGDVDAARERAHAVVESTVRFPMLYAYAMEPYNAVASYGDDGLTVVTTAQHPYMVRDDLARTAVATPAYLGILIALLLMAGGGVTCALALCVPGREATARIGASLVAVGLLGGVGFALTPAFGEASPGYIANSVHYDALCLGVACALAVPVVLFLLGFGVRAAPFASMPTAASASLGAGTG